MSRCKSCGAEILWIKMKSGKAMPVNPERYRFCKVGETTETFVNELGETVKGVPPVIMTGYISHFATCPNADKHRKRMKRKSKLRYKEIIDKGNYDIDDKIGEQIISRKSIAEIEKECGVKRNDRKTKNKKMDPGAAEKRGGRTSG